MNIVFVLQVSISYLEIYNELIKDLLNPSGPLELREDNRGQRITVAGLSEITATNRQEVIQLLIRGNKQRTMEPTLGKLWLYYVYVCICDKCVGLFNALMYSYEQLIKHHLEVMHCLV